jgi:hypothetical protein
MAQAATSSAAVAVPGSVVTEGSMPNSTTLHSTSKLDYNDINKGKLQKLGGKWYKQFFTVTEKTIS